MELDPLGAGWFGSEAGCGGQARGRGHGCYQQEQREDDRETSVSAHGQLGKRRDRPVSIDLAGFHDKDDAANSGDIVDRITTGTDQICL